MNPPNKTITSVILNLSLMAFSNVKLPFGLCNEKLRHIDDVPNGRACNCRCPKCNSHLEARNAGEIRAHYFAHYNSDECEGATETAIHMMAKQIIADSRTIKTPLFEKYPQHKDINGNIHHGQLVKIEEKLVKAEFSCIEDRRQGYITDVTLVIKDRNLLVEIKVTHEVDADKQLKVENNNEAMMEIDLSDIDSAILLDLSKFERYVIHEADRHWIHNPQGIARYKQEMTKLRNNVDQINIRLDKNNRALIEKENTAEPKKILNMRREKHKNVKNIQKKLRELDGYQSPDWQKQREISQRPFIADYPDILKIKLAEQNCGLYPLIEFDAKNAWIFNVHKCIWQAFILNEIVFKAKNGQQLDPFLVKKLVVSKFGILNVAMELNKLKQEYKKIGRERNKWYQDSGCWFLSEQENRKIPSPYQPVIEYLHYLSRLSIIEKNSDNTFSVLIQNLDQYITRTDSERKTQQAIFDMEAAKLNIEMEERDAERNRIAKNKKVRQKENYGF